MLEADENSEIIMEKEMGILRKDESSRDRRLDEPFI